MLSNTALEQRITAYRRCGVTLTRSQQHAELPDLKAAFPEYGAIHRQVLHDVLTRLDKTYQAFFRRVKAGQTPGFPRFQGRNRYHSFTYKQYGNGARLDTGFLVLRKIGRVALRWSRPVGGRAQDRHPLARSGRLVRHHLVRRGASAATSRHAETRDRHRCRAEGVPHHRGGGSGRAPRPYRRGEKKLAKAQRRVSRRKKGSQRRRKAVGWLASALKRYSASAATSTTRPPWRCCARATPSLSKTCGSPTWYGTPTWPRASAMRAGRVSDHPRRQGSLRRASSCGGPRAVHQPGL